MKCSTEKGGITAETVKMAVKGGHADFEGREESLDEGIRWRGSSTDGIKREITKSEPLNLSSIF